MNRSAHFISCTITKQKFINNNLKKIDNTSAMKSLFNCLQAAKRRRRRGGLIGNYQKTGTKEQRVGNPAELRSFAAMSLPLISAANFLLEYFLIFT